MSEWQPIETAPRFGEPLDIWCSKHGRRFVECIWRPPTYGAKRIGDVTISQWCYEDDYDSDGPVYVAVVSPTHWMNAPEPPK